MNRRFAFSLVLVIWPTFTFVYANPPQPGSGPNESNVKAYVIMRDYIEWKQIPQELLKMCKKFDPTGAEPRDAAYAAWSKTHQDEFATFDDLVDKILPNFASASASTHLRPSEFMANYTGAKIVMSLHSTSPEAKSKLCGSYLDILTPLGDPKLVKEGSAFLQNWIRANLERPVDK